MTLRLTENGILVKMEGRAKMSVLAVLGSLNVRFP